VGAWADRAAQRGNDLKIAVFTKNRTNPAYAAARLGAARTAKRLGAETLDFVPETPDDVAQQIRLIDEALAMRPDAFVVAPVHPTKVDDALRRIEAAGIPLCAFVNPVRAIKCVSFAGSDDYALGSAVASHLFRHLGGRGTVLLLSGPAESPTSVPRVQGFEDAARGFPGIRLVGRLMAAFHREPAREQTARWIEREAPFDAVLAANDIMALGALDALRAANRSVIASGVNAVPEAIEAIKSGAMLATADFDAMNLCALATECAIRHLRGERVPEKIDLPVQLVDRSNCGRWDLPFEKRPLRTLEEVIR
jgi:ribose transport system substrate-binding protein